MLGIGQYDSVDRRRVRTRTDQKLFNGKKYRCDKKSRLLSVHNRRPRATSRGCMER